MTTITLQRDSGYSDKFRAYRVFLDKTEICKIKNGETLTLPISPGQHTIQLKIDWCGSRKLDFNIEENQNISFDIKSSLRGLRLILAPYYIIFNAKNYIKINKKD